MPLDTFFLSGIAKELNTQLAGARIDKIQQPAKDLIIFALRGGGFSGRLLICGGSNGFRVHVTDASYENPQTPPMFCMLLRKYLTGARVESVTQPVRDRICEIGLLTYDAMGMECRRRLILEFMGRYTNVILAEEDGLIIDCLRRTGGLDTARSVLPGLYYTRPEPQNKAEVTELDAKGFQKLIDGAFDTLTCDKWLLDTFNGLSPLVCRELAYRAYGNIQPLMEDVKSFDGGMALVVELCDLKTMILDGDFRPTLLTANDGRPKDFSFMEITQYDGVLTSKRVSGFSQLLDMFYTKRDIANRMRDKAQSLIKTVRTARDRTARRLANQTKELKATENREEYRQNGDIIMANLHLIKRGDTVLDAYDFYSEDGSNRKIRLDPAKTPHQNASKYYKDYTKAKNARVILTEQTENGKIELDYLDSVLESLLRVEREQDLEEIRQELVRTGYVKQSKDAKRKPVKQAKPMEFVSSAGFSILVGRNNSQNDELVRSSFKNDIWLHTLKIHGSHVVIRVIDTDPGEKTIEEAAMLAAYYSQARDSEKVPVDWTRIRYVKKPNGAKPGMVTYTNQKTVYVTPDEKIVEKLRLS